jgi:excisionase family DNA binding protein
MEILTASEVSELLRVTENRVILMARRGDIPSLLIDGRVRFDGAEVEAWLKSQRRRTLKAVAPGTVPSGS